MSEKKKEQDNKVQDLANLSIHDQFFSQVDLKAGSSPSSNQWSFNEMQFGEMVAFDQEDGTICCCRESIPHDESLKFTIKASPENLQLTPFANYRAGKIRDNLSTARRNNLS